MFCQEDGKMNKREHKKLLASLDRLVDPERLEGLPYEELLKLRTGLENAKGFVLVELGKRWERMENQE